MTPQSWRHRWLAHRNQLLASRRFQRWASKFALTKSFARRDERALFDLTAGFVFSQIFVACARLQLFDLLADGPLAISEIASRTGLSERAAARLVDGAASLRLLQRVGDRFALGRLGAVMVGNAAITALLEHHSALYQDLADPVAMLRTESASTSLSDYWAYGQAARPSELRTADVTGYSAVMSASQSLVAEEVLEAYRFDRHRRLLDVGGGDGTFVLRVAQRAPQLHVTVFDLPAVVALARQRLDAAGLSQAQACGGDFVRDALPTGADLITLVRVLHDHGDEKVRKVLHAAHQALANNGTLLVAEPMADTPGGESVSAYFNFYFLAMGDGRLRSKLELTHLLHSQGFSSVTEARSAAPQHIRILLARRN